jgi:hypothetical protein
MARPRKIIPTYRNKEGKGVVTVYTEARQRKEIALPGPYNSAESREEYGRVLAPASRWRRRTAR